jgi:cellulose synthase/poly-beta-1,6-N-acetylglucosamine synthase-like glycosyltransferase
MDTFLLCFALVSILYHIVLWKLLQAYSPEQKKMAELPFVSVLVAAKNEEQNIATCIESLLQLDYPAEKLEILIANDASDDATPLILKKYEQQYSQIKILHIHHQLKHLKAKANALAQLAREAKGTYFFITDADTKVQKTWIKHILSYFDDRIGIVSGTTQVEAFNIFHQLQNLEWLYSFGLISAAAHAKIPVTAIGNNMCVSKAAYDSVGGYENIPFSITEDYQLFKEIIQKDWSYIQLCDPESLNTTQAIRDLKTLWHQRKRWMQGAIQIAWILKLYFAIQLMYIPLFSIGFWCYPIHTLVLLNIDLGFQFLLLQTAIDKANHAKLSPSIFLSYKVYSLFTGLMSAVAHAWPKPVKWKNQDY